MVVITYEHDLSFALGALAANTALKGATKIDSSRLNGFRVAKVRLAATIRGKTTDEGPILWGLSANMSAAEIKAAIEADPQDSTADNSKGEGAWLTFLGQITHGSVEGPLTGGIGPDVSAPVMDVKVNWSVLEGKDFSLFAYNMDSGALTTGATIAAVLEIFGVWLRD